MAILFSSQNHFQLGKRRGNQQDRRQTMPKAPRPATQPRKDDPPKKRTYTVIEDGVPEAAAFLVLEKGFTVAHAARILHAKRKALSKHVQKFRENRALLHAPRRGNVALDGKSSAGQESAAVESIAAMTSALVNKSVAAAAAAEAAVAGNNALMLENRFPVEQESSETAAQINTRMDVVMMSVVSAIPELGAAQENAEASEVSTIPELAVAQENGEASVVLEVQPSFSGQGSVVAAARTFENKSLAAGADVVAPSSAELISALSDCSCCARCQEWKRLQK